jgi:prolyl 4-hydroxylase
MLEGWTRQRLATTSVYGIRIYHNQSILSPHVDRLPLVASVIINVAQDVDEDWPLEVYDHEGVAHNITMEPGDMVLYESHSVIHGRPFRLNGAYFANVFIHFEPIGPLSSSELTDNGDLPPYLIRDSSWEPEWRRDHPDGWIQDPRMLVQRGDLMTLWDMAEKYPWEVLHRADQYGWRPLHEACRQGQLDIVQFLVEHGANIHGVAKVQGGMTPYKVATQYLKPGHPVIAYLSRLLHGESSREAVLRVAAISRFDL